MNILALNWQDIKNPFAGGAEVHFHEIFKRIAAKGHKVTLLCCSFKDAPAEENIDGIRVIRAGQRNLFNFKVHSLYKQITKKEKFDIVIDDINKIPFYTPLYVKEPLLAISHHFFGKSIYRESDVFSGTYVYISEWLMNFVYKKTPFTVVSQSTLEEFKHKGFDTSNFTIIYNAIDQDIFHFTVKNKNPEPTVTYFGRLKKYKSVDHLFHAFAKVHKTIPNAKLNILGRGDFREYLEKLAVELGIDKNVKFFGFVDENTKQIELTKSYCVVNTSLKEGWGITNIEANACGTPVISANSPGLRDSVKDGVSGTLYEYGNIDQLAEHITKIFTDEEYRNKLSTGAIEWAKNFSWDKSADEMLNKCIEVINNKNK